MNKTIVAASIGLALGIPTSASAAFFAGSATYRVDVNPVGSCFAFGNCPTLVDNVQGGSFTLSTDATGDAFSVGGYAVGVYTGTPGGVFTTGGPVAGSGTVGAGGEIDLDFAGRTGSAAGFPYLGTPAWNLDNNSKTGGTNAYEGFTSGTDSNLDQTDTTGGTTSLTLTGTHLAPIVAGTTTGKLVSIGNVGSAWGPFDGTPYSEVYTITVTATEGLPLTADETLSVDQDVAKDFVKADLLVNDTHPVAPPASGLTLVSVGPTAQAGAGSTVVLAADGNSFTYTPPSGVSGLAADSFSYTVSDAGFDSTVEMDTGTVTIDITSSGGTDPVAENDAVTTDEDMAISFDPIGGAAVTPGVVNDTDVETATANLIILSVENPTAAQNGTVSFVNNDITYTPNPDFNGADTFSYTIRDENGQQGTGEVAMTVTPVNDKPVCSDVDLVTPIGKVLAIAEEDLIATTSTPPLCTDVDGDVLTIATFDTASTESGTISGDGATPQTLTYTPPPAVSGVEFEGLDTFTFTATDGIENADPKTATVNVADAKLGNFTMLKSIVGERVGGTNDIVFDWDRTSFSTSVTDPVTATTAVATMRSKGNAAEPDGHKFRGAVWVAHHIRMFGPGSYTFDTTCSLAKIETIGTEKCDDPFTVVNGVTVQKEQFITIEVGPNQVLAHILFDWNGTNNIDVFNLYDKQKAWDRLGATGERNKLFTGDLGLPPAEDTEWELVSTDGDGDGFVGIAMIDGAFVGFSASFNFGPGETGVGLKDIDTEISDTSLSSLNLWGLMASLFSIISLRLFRTHSS